MSIPLKKMGLLCVLIFVAFLETGFFEVGGASQDQSKTLNLENIKRITRSTYLIQHEYYDPARIKPIEMLKEGFYELAKEIPEALPVFNGSTLQFQLGAQKVDIPLGSIKQLYDIFPVVSEAFNFLKKNYRGKSKFDDMEYAFIGGMLSVLDPHSNILPPKVYEEFKTQTQGEYGGLGIVIGIKNLALTVISPIEDTPASRVGILADDKILEIDGQSTTNMPLNDAVDLMRGPPKTKVVLKISSKNRPPRDVTITREIIVIKSVVAKHVEQNGKHFGIIRIKGFQEDTFRDLVKELGNLEQKSNNALKGIVLDLRNNPGGLLDQAIIIADKFLESGDIVFTVGANNEDEEAAVAQRKSDDNIIPMIVMINQGSASASEIVAGALKNNHRAIVIGQRSFGKGSVQSLFSLRDGSSLKLTVAQYLTPGRESIQALGISPDIHLYASSINNEYFDLVENIDFTEEKLDAHLDRTGDRNSSNSKYTLTYLNSKEPDDASESSYTSKIKEDDFEIKLAINILDKAASPSTAEMLDKTNAILKKEALQQDGLIAEALNKMNIDWSHEQTNNTPKLKVQHKFIDTNGSPVVSIRAGSTVEMVTSVQNLSSETVSRVVTEINSLNPLINNREFVFGKIKPGEEKTAKIVIVAPPEIMTFSENIKLLTYTEKTAQAPHKYLAATRFTEQEQPRLAFSYKIDDGGKSGTKGNQNGIPEKGEKIAMDISVKNLGPGVSKDTIINIKNTEGKHVFLGSARETIGLLNPSDESTKTLHFDIKDSFNKSDFSIEFFAIDNETKANINDTLSFHIVPPHSADPVPGQIQIAPEVTLSDKIRQTGDRLFISGTATDPDNIKDITIFVKGRKIKYINLESVPPVRSKDFDAELLLEEGINSIIVQARDAGDLQTQKTMSFVFNKESVISP
ncbi:MAG: PDZ domain-containing protein [Deltaproteobacteria bacterium]|nr:PDZ domain-containing protein [Deltaproteobacteria bacterium]